MCLLRPPQAFTPLTVVRQVLHWLSIVAAAVRASDGGTADVGATPTVPLRPAQTIADKNMRAYAGSVSAMLEMLLAFQSHCAEDRLLLTEDVRAICVWNCCEDAF